MEDSHVWFEYKALKNDNMKKHIFTYLISIDSTSI